MASIEEQHHIAKEAAFTTLGRAIADFTIRGDSAAAAIEEACVRRRQEQDSADRDTQFSSLARQVGDAQRSGRDIAPLLAKLVKLRRAEIGPPVTFY